MAPCLWVRGFLSCCRIRLKAELEQRERRLKEQVSSLSEKLSLGETGSKDSLSRRNTDKGTVLQPSVANSYDSSS